MEHYFKGMPPAPKLLAAWQKALAGQSRGILQSSHLTRKERETLQNAGHLEPIMRGWYQLREDPGTDVPEPDLAAFLPQYLEKRLGSHWCLSAASSLAVRCRGGALPAHVVVQSSFGSTTVHTFGDGTRLTVYQDENQLPTRLETIGGLRVMSPDNILARLTAAQWDQSLGMVDQILGQISSWEGFVWFCLKEGRNQALYRLLKRLQDLGRNQEAGIVAAGLKAAGLQVQSLEAPGEAAGQEAETPSPGSHHAGRPQRGSGCFPRGPGSTVGGRSHIGGMLEPVVRPDTGVVPAAQQPCGESPAPSLLHRERPARRCPASPAAVWIRCPLGGHRGPFHGARESSRGLRVAPSG